MSTPWGQQPPMRQHPDRPWWKKKRFNIPLGVLAIIVIVAIVSPDSEPEVKVADSSAAATAPASANGKAVKPKPVPKPVGFGTKVRDGKFEFVVKSITRKQKIGSEYLNQKAQGKFLLVEIKVTNIGDEAQSFLGSNQKLIDKDGREFSSDDTTAMYLDESNSFIEEINPGNSLTGVVVFDVPKDVEAAKIELHDSAFSGGKTVNLR